MCYSLKKTVFALALIFVISGLIFTCNANFGAAQTPTTVIGIIFSDTTWTPALSPYNITGPAAVAKGATLTIQPGVTVNFNMFTLQVNGTLTAVGTPSDQITLDGGYQSRYPVFGSEARNGRLVFTDQSIGWNNQTGTGSIIQNVNIISLTISTRVSLKVDSNAFSGTYADFAVDSIAGAPTITNNYLNGAAIGVEGGAPFIYNNTIEGYAVGGGEGVSISGGSPQIFNNVFFQGYTCIYIDGNAYVTIANNVIANYSSGLFAYSYGDLVFQNNLLIYDSNGLSFSGSAIAFTDIENNTIAYSSIALYYPPLPITIRYNNLEYNQKNIVWQSSSNLDAADNWWGTTDPSAISQSIYDYKNDYNLGNVTFTPFLNATNSQAPSISSFSLPYTPPISTPTPT